MITVEQCRAGRALLGWSAQRLAAEAGIGVATVRRYESGSAIVEASALAIEQAIIAAGVILIANGTVPPKGGPGVRFKAQAGTTDS